MTLTVTNVFSDLVKTTYELDEPELVNAIIRHLRAIVPSLESVKLIHLSVDFEDYDDGDQYKAIVTYRKETLKRETPVPDAIDAEIAAMTDEERVAAIAATAGCWADDLAASVVCVGCGLTEDNCQCASEPNPFCCLNDDETGYE